MECIRYIFPAGAQAWLPPAKTPRLACQQICDALGRNKHRHFCSFWPKLRRTISALYCFYMRDNAFLPIVLENMLNAHQKNRYPIHATQKQNTFILFPSLFNKKWFLNLDAGELHSSRNQAAFIWQKQHLRIWSWTLEGTKDPYFSSLVYSQYFPATLQHWTKERCDPCPK